MVVFSCRQFIPTCFCILVERFADQVVTSSVLDSEDGMRTAIMQCFTEFDTEGALFILRHSNSSCVIAFSTVHTWMDEACGEPAVGFDDVRPSFL